MDAVREFLTPENFGTSSASANTSATITQNIQTTNLATKNNSGTTVNTPNSASPVVMPVQTVAITSVKDQATSVDNKKASVLPET